MKRLVSLCLGLAMALVAGQAFAFGGVAGAGHFSGARVGSAGPASIHGVNVNGAVTVGDITVLPDGSMIVPAVTPRVSGTVGPLPPKYLQLPMTRIKPCPYNGCGQ